MLFLLLGHLVVLLNGSPKPEACWSVEGYSHRNYLRSLSHPQWILCMNRTRLVHMVILFNGRPKPEA